jgi:hypothetical protein
MMLDNMLQTCYNSHIDKQEWYIMIVQASSGRYALEMTTEEALDLIAKLSRSVAQATRTENSWFAEGVSVDVGLDHNLAGRMVFRVEK